MKAGAYFHSDVVGSDPRYQFSELEANSSDFDYSQLRDDHVHTARLLNRKLTASNNSGLTVSPQDRGSNDPSFCLETIDERLCTDSEVTLLRNLEGLDHGYVNGCIGRLVTSDIDPLGPISQ
jgi:hypothetical protein